MTLVLPRTDKERGIGIEKGDGLLLVPLTFWR